MIGIWLFVLGGKGMWGCGESWRVLICVCVYVLEKSYLRCDMVLFFVEGFYFFVKYCFVWWVCYFVFFRFWVCVGGEFGGFVVLISFFDNGDDSR